MGLVARDHRSRYRYRSPHESRWWATGPPMGLPGCKRQRPLRPFLTGSAGSGLPRELPWPAAAATQVGLALPGGRGYAGCEEPRKKQPKSAPEAGRGRPLMTRPAPMGLVAHGVRLPPSSSSGPGRQPPAVAAASALPAVSRAVTVVTASTRWPRPGTARRAPARQQPLPDAGRVGAR